MWSQQYYAEAFFVLRSPDYENRTFCAIKLVRCLCCEFHLPKTIIISLSPTSRYNHWISFANARSIFNPRQARQSPVSINHFCAGSVSATQNNYHYQLSGLSYATREKRMIFLRFMPNGVAKQTNFQQSSTLQRSYFELLYFRYKSNTFFLRSSHQKEENYAVQPPKQIIILSKKITLAHW